MLRDILLCWLHFLSLLLLHLVSIFCPHPSFPAELFLLAIGAGGDEDVLLLLLTRQTDS